MNKLLESLECPFSDNIDLSDDGVVKLVCWLEDRKIREYEIAQRAVLREFSPTWSTAMNEVKLLHYF
jgi:hypothetical protein